MVLFEVVVISAVEVGAPRSNVEGLAAHPVPQCPLAPSGTPRVPLVSINIAFAPLSRFLMPALALEEDDIFIHGQLLRMMNEKRGIQGLRDPVLVALEVVML